MSASVTLRAPAKLNLTLEVLARKGDGLHGIRSVMVPLDLFDEIRIDPNARGFELLCDDPPLQSGNLIEKALRAVGAHTDLRITLRKRIPVQAGMGGGSSDGAAILLAAQRKLIEAPDGVDFLAAAHSLGSDVPFFLVETAALVEGTGERVTALGNVPPWHAVIVKPPVAVSTATAYAQLDRHPREPRPRNASVSLALAEALQRTQFERVVELLSNDFEGIVLRDRPEIAEAARMLQAAGAARTLLSGSGSSVFALAPDAKTREQLMQRITAPDGYRVFGCAFWSGEAWRSAA